MKNSLKFLLKVIVISVIYYLLVLSGVYLYFERYPLNGKLVGLLNALLVMKVLINAFVFIALLYLSFNVYLSIRKINIDITRGYVFAIIYVLIGFYIFNFI
jgi:hypothetical protein